MLRILRVCSGIQKFTSQQKPKYLGECAPTKTHNSVPENQQRHGIKPQNNTEDRQ